MTYDVAVISALTFIVSMFCLEKNHVPRAVKTLSLLKIVPLCLLAISLGIGLTILTHLLYFIIIISIMSACLIFWRYHQRMDDWEDHRHHDKN
jgi:thiamine transporter ThiT